MGQKSKSGKGQEAQKTVIKMNLISLKYFIEISFIYYMNYCNYIFNPESEEMLS